MIVHFPALRSVVKKEIPMNVSAFGIFERKFMTYRSFGISHASLLSMTIGYASIFRILPYQKQV